MNQYNRCMIDIETLGREPGCVILSIGAVKFGMDGLGDEFYRSIDVGSCTDHGLDVEGQTLEWWLGQDQAVRGQLVGGRDLRTALRAFNDYYGDPAEVWANSPAFDCAILECAYEKIGVEEPWEYYEKRDYRTISDLPLAPHIPPEGAEHNALDDAINQARVASKTLSRVYNLHAEHSGLNDNDG